MPSFGHPLKTIRGDVFKRVFMFSNLYFSRGFRDFDTAVEKHLFGIVNQTLPGP